MWMDKINDHIDYNSMGDSYYRNIGIYWKWTVLFSESAIRAMFTTERYPVFTVSEKLPSPINSGHNSCF